MQDNRITTGVDSLLEMVKEKKRISTKAVAKSLSISPTLVEAWASFLQEQGIIDIQYKLLGTYLVYKKPEEDDGKDVFKDIEKDKSYIKTKSNNLWVFLEKLDARIIELEKDFKKHSLKDVKEEMEFLKRLENEKDEINQKLIDERHNAIEELQKVNAQLDSEREKARVTIAELGEELLDEDNIFSLEKTQLKILRDNQEQLKSHLKKLHKIAGKKSYKMSKTENKTITKAEKELLEVREHIDAFEKEFKHDKDKFTELDNQVIQREKLLEKAKNDVVKKIKTYKDGLKNNEWKEIRELLDERHYVSKILQNLRMEENNLRKYVLGLKHKGKETSGIKELGTLEKELEKIVSRRGDFEQKLKKMIHEKEEPLSKKNSKKGKKASSKKAR